uniref:C-type lectin domain-containing protein n=1 Tax=Panagrolaimus davidi TaxID=227884 RepID=A0A914P2D5_9BILA
MEKKKIFFLRVWFLSCVFLGLCDLAQSSVAYIGLWGFDGGVALKTWYDATPVDYTNWAPGYPITLGDVFGSDADIACVFLTPSGQFKQGLNCDEPRNFICKKPAA